MEDVMKHAFFKPINWRKLEKLEVPPLFIPDVNGHLCVQNFDSHNTEMPIDMTPYGTPEQRFRRSSTPFSATGAPAIRPRCFFFPCSVRSANAVAKASTPGSSPQKRRLGPRRTGEPRLAVWRGAARRARVRRVPQGPAGGGVERTGRPWSRRTGRRRPRGGAGRGPPGSPSCRSRWSGCAGRSRRRSGRARSCWTARPRSCWRTNAGSRSVGGAPQPRPPGD